MESLPATEEVPTGTVMSDEAVLTDCILLVE